VINLLQLPGWLGAGLFMLAAVAFSALPLFLSRRVLAGEPHPKTRDVIEAVGVRIGTVHSLILALVFADAQANHSDLQQQVAQEVTAVQHVALHLNQWPGPEKDALRGELADYVRAVLRTEWGVTTSLHGGREVKLAYDQLDLAILTLQADTPRQQSLRTRMIADMDSLQEHRKARLSLVNRGLPSLFGWMVFAGFAITVGFFFVFPATPLHIAILSIYGAYTGLVVYFILALSHPYIGPAAISPSGYEALLQDDLARASPIVTQENT
jgi:hypothetical protein